MGKGPTNRVILACKLPERSVFRADADVEEDGVEIENTTAVVQAPKIRGSVRTSVATTT
jgi:hypothetical protein